MRDWTKMHREGSQFWEEVGEHADRLHLLAQMHGAELDELGPDLDLKPLASAVVASLALLLGLRVVPTGPGSPDVRTDGGSPPRP